MQQILKIISVFILLSYLIIAQPTYLMNLGSPQVINNETIEFDVNIESTGGYFILTSYQCVFDVNSEFLNDTSFCFEYIPSSSELSNTPIYGLGCCNVDGLKKIHFASSAGRDSITNHFLRVGRFRIKKSAYLLIDSLNVNWTFDGIYKTILTGENFQEITESSNHTNLIFTIEPSVTSGFTTLNAEDGILEGDVHLKTKAGSNCAQVVYFLNTYSTLSFSVNLDKNGEWFAWGRMFFESNESPRNSFYIQVDNGEKIVFGDDNNSYDKWHWEGDRLNKLSLGTLTYGNHKITIYGRAGEAGPSVMLDKILLTQDSDLIASDNLFDSVTPVTEIKNIPETFNLSQNYPNPFNPSTKIQYSINQLSTVKLEIYSILGERIAQLKNEIQDAGTYKMEWNASDYASGTYILSLNATSADGSNSFKSTKKMVLIK